MDHNLKCVQPWFDQVWNGDKPLEIRKLDRDFRIGDTLWLREYYPERRVAMDEDYYGRRCIKAEITTIVRAAQYPEGIKPGYGVLGIKILERIENYDPFK